MQENASVATPEKKIPTQEPRKVEFPWGALFPSPEPKGFEDTLWIRDYRNQDTTKLSSPHILTGTYDTRTPGYKRRRVLLSNEMPRVFPTYKNGPVLRVTPISFMIASAIVFCISYYLSADVAWERPPPPTLPMMTGWEIPKPSFESMFSSSRRVRDSNQTRKTHKLTRRPVPTAAKTSSSSTEYEKSESKTRTTTIDNMKTSLLQARTIHTDGPAMDNNSSTHSKRYTSSSSAHTTDTATIPSKDKVDENADALNSTMSRVLKLVKTQSAPLSSETDDKVGNRGNPLQKLKKAAASIATATNAVIKGIATPSQHQVATKQCAKSAFWDRQCRRAWKQQQRVAHRAKSRRSNSSSKSVATIDSSASPIVQCTNLWSRECRKQRRDEYQLQIQSSFSEASVY